MHTTGHSLQAILVGYISHQHKEDI